MYKTLVQQFEEAFGIIKPKKSLRQRLRKTIRNSHIYHKFRMKRIRENPYKENFENYL